MNVSCITTKQIVYEPVDVPSAGSISGSKSVWCSLSWAHVTRVTDWAQGTDVCEYAYPAGILMNSRHWAPEVLSVEAGDVPGRGGVGSGGSSGVGSGVCCLRWLGRGAPVPLRLQCVCRFSAVPCWEGRHLGVWLWRSIAECHSIPAFTSLYPGQPTPRFFSSRTSARGFLIRYWVSSIAARETSSSAILAMFKARRM